MPDNVALGQDAQNLHVLIDYNTTAEQLGSIVSTNQSANSNDVETLIELIATFQSALTSEELVELYPERAEFAAQTLMLLDGN